MDQNQQQNQHQQQLRRLQERAVVALAKSSQRLLASRYFLHLRSHALSIESHAKQPKDVNERLEDETRVARQDSLEEEDDAPRCTACLSVTTPSTQFVEQLGSEGAPAVEPRHLHELQRSILGQRRALEAKDRLVQYLTEQRDAAVAMSDGSGAVVLKQRVAELEGQLDALRCELRAAQEQQARERQRKENEEKEKAGEEEEGDQEDAAAPSTCPKELPLAPPQQQEQPEQPLPVTDTATTSKATSYCNKSAASGEKHKGKKKTTPSSSSTRETVHAKVVSLDQTYCFAADSGAAVSKPPPGAIDDTALSVEQHQHELLLSLQHQVGCPRHPGFNRVHQHHHHQHTQSVMPATGGGGFRWQKPPTLHKLCNNELPQDGDDGDDDSNDQALDANRERKKKSAHKKNTDSNSSRYGTTTAKRHHGNHNGIDVASGSGSTASSGSTCSGSFSSSANIARLVEEDKKQLAESAKQRRNDHELLQQQLQRRQQPQQQQQGSRRPPNPATANQQQQAAAAAATATSGYYKYYEQLLLQHPSHPCTQQQQQHPQQLRDQRSVVVPLPSSATVPRKFASTTSSSSSASSVPKSGSPSVALPKILQSSGMRQVK